MKSKTRDIVTVALAAAFFLGLFLWCLLKSPEAVSASERRELAQMPEISAETLLSGSFMADFEKYSMDQFPARDGFRGVSALYSRYVARQKDIDGIYTVDGYIAKLDHPLDRSSLDNAAAKFQKIYDNYLDGAAGSVYLAVIPDKSQFMAPGRGYPCVDFEAMTDYLRSKLEFAEYIDISGTLGLADYYRTDSHWRQEKLPDTARALAEAMGVSLEAQYTENTLGKPFMGVYGGQSALPHAAEEIKYLTYPELDAMSVYDYEIDREIEIYDMERGSGDDGYELFLSGPRSLQKISNPNAPADRKLIIFRDSFGSSIAPLLAEAYSEITLVDIRYLASDFLGMMVDFEGADVLFLYSEFVMNNSITLK